MKSFGLICVFLGMVWFANAKLPSYINVCKRSDPEISTCIKDSIMSLKKHLADGIPELKVPSIEPLEIASITIKRAVQSNITDIKIYGASNYEVLEIKAEPEKNRYAFSIKVPDMYFTSNYELDMKILVINLQGKGQLFANLTDYQFTGLLKGKKMKIEGQSHLAFDPMKLNIIQGKSHLQLDNLFDGKDEKLAQATNQVINDSPDTFLSEILPLLEIAIAEQLTDVANIIASTFTYDELFPQ